MKSRYQMMMGLGVLALMAATIVLMTLALPAGAAPSAQMLPTPTLWPVGEVAYTLEAVGGVDETLTFDFGEVDGITLGESTVTSVYPNGMIFTLNPVSANGDIDYVALTITLVSGIGTRVAAEFDEENQVWVSHPWIGFSTQPAWTHFDFQWSVGDTSGAFAETEPTPMDYWDPTRQWFRMESEYFVMYWFGLSDDDPDRFASRVAYAVASTHQRRVEGFGEPISYKSTGIIYGSRAAWDEIYPDESNPTAGGQTSAGMGVTVMYVTGGDTAGAIEWLAGALTHELTHLYQFDVVGGAWGPGWWSEGQAEWFAFNPNDYDARIFNLATMQDIPTLSTEVGRETIQADGRQFLHYDLGASFINWLIATYGIETHAGIVALMKTGIPFYDSIEEVTGQSFFDLENAYRAYIGVPPFALADLHPELALEPVIDPIAEVGDVLTLPATPPLVNIYKDPGPRVVMGGQCFANMEVTILAMGSLEGVDYYQVDCMGQVGWMSRDQLAGS